MLRMEASPCTSVSGPAPVIACSAAVTCPTARSANAATETSDPGARPTAARSGHTGSPRDQRRLRPAAARAIGQVPAPPSAGACPPAASRPRPDRPRAATPKDPQARGASRRQEPPLPGSKRGPARPRPARSRGRNAPRPGTCPARPESSRVPAGPGASRSAPPADARSPSHGTKPRHPSTAAPGNRGPRVTSVTKTLQSRGGGLRNWAG